MVEITILRKDIDEMRALSKSLMPDGLEKELTPQNLADLIGFLRHSLGPVVAAGVVLFDDEPAFVAALTEGDALLPRHRRQVFGKGRTPRDRRAKALAAHQRLAIRNRREPGRLRPGGDRRQSPAGEGLETGARPGPPISIPALRLEVYRRQGGDARTGGEGSLAARRQTAPSLL